MLSRLIPALAITALLGVPAVLASQHGAAEAYKEAMDKMHQAMPMEFSGNADADFANSMIPHHQGAIDMAEIELQYGKDPELRQMAERIIADQEREIAEMKAWLQKNGS
ncbi:MAG TPA: DUF305 domain-containing protein [Dongiaceae bacterium]|nr:DUF305 domain-containing protein [Dongiaceae bacterium]